MFRWICWPGLVFLSAGYAGQALYSYKVWVTPLLDILARPCIPPMGRAARRVHLPLPGLHESFTNLRQGGGRPGLRSQLRRLSAREICRETRCFLQRRFAKRRVSRGFLRAAAVKHRVSRCFLARTFTKRRVSRCFLRPALSNTRASRGFLLWPAAPSVHQAGRGGLRVGFRCRAGLVCAASCAG